MAITINELAKDFNERGIPIVDLRPEMPCATCGHDEDSHSLPPFTAGCYVGIVSETPCMCDGFKERQA